MHPEPMHPEPMHPEARALIRTLGLEPLAEEGGWFRQTWQAPDGVGTAILAVFTDEPEGFSAMHRLTATEVWHLYRGDPFELLLLHPDGSSDRARLDPQLVVPPGTWMGGRPAGPGGWSFLGTTMAPGWTEQGFELGDRPALQAAYPDRAGDIARLTRDA
jgi:predicted cupin superfamily sugar epimerase